MEKQKISEYTEKEFLDFVTGICKANYPTEEAAKCSCCSV